MDIASIALGGLNQAQSLLDRAAIRVSNSASTANPLDLAASAVELSQAKTEFAANIQVVKTVDDLEKRSINLLG
jgi:flagellar hook protein FlgE